MWSHVEENQNGTRFYVHILSRYEKKRIRRIEKSSVIFLRNPILSLTKYGEQKNKITKLTPREILELFVDDVAHTISREYSFLLLKILRRHRTDRDLTMRNIIYYRDNLWIIVLVKSKNARYAYRIGPEMLLLCARLAVESSAPITYVIEPFPTSHGLASLPSISNTFASRGKEIITSIREMVFSFETRITSISRYLFLFFQFESIELRNNQHGNNYGKRSIVRSSNYAQMERSAFLG